MIVRMKKVRILQLLVLLGGLLCCTALLAHTNSISADSNPSLFDIMHYQEVVDITLETDLAPLKDQRNDVEYQKAKFSFKDEQGQQRNWDIRVRIRGNFRRKFCNEFPPLKVDFDKDDLRAEGLADFDDMKLVTFCLDDKYVAKKLLLKEYLAYKFFNQLSDISYRVQLVKITYIDSNTGNKSKQWGFFIEDTAQLQDRLNLVDCESCYNRPMESFNQEQLETVSLFQYLIGNSDWDLVHIRNVKLFTKAGKIIPVPYDFDFSGLVNAPYAIPNPDFQLESRQERVYLGFAESLEDMEGLKQEFMRKMPELVKITKKFKPLNLEGRAEVTEYLGSFYENDINNIQLPPQKQVPVETDDD